MIRGLFPQLEVKERATPPSWYPPGPVLFRFVQISDVHLNPHTEPFLRAACAFVNERIEPAFVVVTGDNAGSSTPAAQRGFRDLLAASLKAPWFVIRGDNWPRNFTAVFGSFQWSFDCGGIHLIASGLDVDVENLGIGRFLPESLTWIREDLNRNGDRPVVYFQHEPIQPPTFLDARRLDRLLESNPNVLLTMSGHLHMDLASRTGRVVHIIAPALGPSSGHGFKVAEVYGDRLVIRTVEYVKKRYRYVKKYQRIDIPENLRRTLAAEKPRIKNITKRPPRDTSFDNRLLWRQAELAADFLKYAQKIRRQQRSDRAMSPTEESKGSRAGSENHRQSRWFQEAPWKEPW